MGEANIWQPRTTVNFSTDSKQAEESFTAIAGQSLFFLQNFTYAVGTGSLSVHKNGLLLANNVDWVEQSAGSFSLVIPCGVGDRVVATALTAITGDVDVRDTDIFLANYQAFRDYAGAETTARARGKLTPGDGGEHFFTLVGGQPLGFYVDNNSTILLPTGGNGTIAWIRRLIHDDTEEVAKGHDNLYSRRTTVPLALVSDVTLGETVLFTDRFDAVYDVVTGEVGNGFDILQHSTLALQFKWRPELPCNPVKIGADNSGGSFDNTPVFRYALDTYWNVEPESGIYGLADTLQVKSYQRLWGTSEAVRPDATITANLQFKWIGIASPRKAVILVGANDVGVDPVAASSGSVVGNFYVNANNLAGFGVYSTYSQNEVLFHRISTSGTTEIGFYIAKCFYGKITGIYSFEEANNGISIGMPLVYKDGTFPVWVETAEVNRLDVTDLRSQSAGQRFKIGGPDAGTWNPANPALRAQGYGVGLGIGNGFFVSGVTSEKSGGVTLYCLTNSQPVKVISDMYLEFPAVDSGLDPASTMPVIIIEGLSTQGGEYFLKNMLCNFGSGGVYTTGLHRPIVLENLHQPRFLKTLDDLILDNPKGFVSLRNCYSGLGLASLVDTVPNNYDEAVDIDSASWATLVTPKVGVGAMNVYVRPKVGFTQKGSIGYRRLDGTTTIFNWAAYAKVTPIDVMTLLFSTNTGEVDRILGVGLGTGSNTTDILVEYAKPSFQANIEP